MSILNVEHVTHGFGARQILNDASFRLLKGEHVGLVGANGEGKSTFLNIITGKLMPDEGKVEWCRHITTGYLDQYSTLEKGKTIRDVLQEAFRHLSELEAEMNQSLGNAKSLVLDFSKLDYISSAGLRVLLSAHKVMSAKGGMKVTNVNEIVREVFEVTGFADILTIE